MAPTGAGLRMVALKSWLLKSALSICGSGIAGGGGLNRKWIADSPKHTGISPAGWTCTQGKYGGSGKPRGELPYHILMTDINKAGRAGHGPGESCNAELLNGIKVAAAALHGKLTCTAC